MSEEERERSKLPRPPKPRLPQQDLTMPGQTVATNLSPQLGTNARILSQAEFDMRLLSRIDEPMLRALVYFAWRGNKVRFWKHIVEQTLHLSVSVNGIGRKQLIEMQRAATGVPGTPEPERPGWLERNVTNREWQEREK